MFNKLTNRILIWGLSVVAVIITVMAVMFVTITNSSVEREMRSSLSEAAHHVSKLIDYKVDSLFDNLGAMSRACSQIYNNNVGSTEKAIDRMTEYLGYMELEYEFERIAYINAADRGVYYDASSHKDEPAPGWVLDEPGFEFLDKAFAGEKYVTDVMHRATKVDPGRTVEVVYFAVPFYSTPEEDDRGDVVGALLAYALKAQLASLLAVETFGGEGYGVVVGTDGKFIFSSGHKNLLQGCDNFFDALDRERNKQGVVERIENDFLNRTDGVVGAVRADGRRMIYSYISLGVNRWYLVNAVPQTVVGRNTAAFKRAGIVSIVVVVVLFLALIFLILWMQTRNRRELEQMAYVDPITGGTSRMRFEREVAGAIAKAEKSEYAYISFDIQRFKLINDTFGAEKGNLALKYVYRVVAEKLGAGEFLTRTAADTFNMFVRFRDRESLKNRLISMTDDVNRYNDALESKYYMPFVYGVYIVDKPSIGFISVQDRANIARKSAKNRGVSALAHVEFYDNDLHRQLKREKEITNRQETALASGEFIPYLQPKIDMKTGRVSGCEVLARWNDPQRGLVQPSEFIGVFEKNGFIVRLDLYIFEQALKLEEKWLAQGERMPVSVNLSRAHLMSPTFFDEYLELMSRYNVDPGLIEFEITESLVFENRERLSELIDVLHASGFTCSLDDFGSGYSSLNTLKDVRVDLLKIDRGFFVESVQGDERGKKVIEAVIRLAKKLEMRVVAEGVETREQVDFLRKAACDEVQGFVFSKPLPVDEFEKFRTEINGGGRILEISPHNQHNAGA